MAQMEAWSSGLVRIEVEGLDIKPTWAVVEILRVSFLVHAIARADSEDPSLAGIMPMVMSSVVVYPVRSFAPDPLAALGKELGDQFFAQVVKALRDQLGGPLATAPPS